MTKQIGQTYMNAAKTRIAEIVGITETGRIKYEAYTNGKKWNAAWTVAEATFNKDYPIFVASA